MLIHLKELVQKAKTGNVDAFDKLYRLHIRLIYAYVNRFVFCEADVKDVVSVVFVKAISKIKSFKDQSSFTTWLVRIADNAIKDLFRKKSRYSDNPVEDIPLEQVPDRITEIQIKTIVHEALQILTPKQKEVLVLHGLQEYTFKETANKLALSQRAVKSRYYLAIERLRKYLVLDPFVQEYLQEQYQNDEKPKSQRTEFHGNNCSLLSRS